MECHERKRSPALRVITLHTELNVAVNRLTFEFTTLVKLFCADVGEKLSVPTCNMLIFIVPILVSQTVLNDSVNGDAMPTSQISAL